MKNYTSLCAMSVVLFVACCSVTVRASADEPAPVTALTSGPEFHWFGYYDKFQFDPHDRYVLGMAVDFEFRSPAPDDRIKIGMVDLRADNRWIELGESRAWGWQQGCMLQWRPGSDTEILWNDREGGRFVCRILDVKTRELRTFSHPVYHVSPDGKFALGTDFSRIQDQRPGYGYPGIPDENADVLAPEGSSIYLLNLDTGQCTDLISLSDIGRLRYRGQTVGGKLHFNHIQWSPDGERFIFLNRVNGNRGTISYTSDLTGTDIRLLGTDSSHFEWRDPEHALIWSKGAYRLHRDDGSGQNEVILKAPNGHNSYLPGKEWFVTDTYPRGEKREQVVYLYHVPTGTKVELGRFHLPKDYTGEWRCDTHPRLSRDGTKVVIDSPHGGNGRQLYMIDFGRILAREQEKIAGLDGHRWDFDTLDGWQDDSQGNSPHSYHLDKGTLRMSTRANTRDRVKVRTTERFGAGTYTWRVYTPAMGKGDQASIGAFLYRDDKHEVDFEIGHGKAAVRDKLKAADTDLVCYCTSQGHPFSSTPFLVERDAWHTLSIALKPNAAGHYEIAWSVDGTQLKQLQTSFGTETTFTAHCSVENLTFIGDHIPAQDNYALFDWFEFLPAGSH